MNDFLLYRMALTAAALAETGGALWLMRRKPEDTAQTDKIPREKYTGIVLGFFALLWCVPYAKPIVFDWMLPLLYPLAAVLAVLGWFFLDYLLSRALGGILILSAYFFVHGGFEFHTPYLAGFSILYWLLGTAGIAFSGKPCWMRDFLRCCCRKRLWRIGAGVFLLVLAAASLFAAVFSAGAAE